MLDSVLKSAGVLAVASGTLIVVDSAAVDLVGNENTLANTGGVLATVLAVFALGGVYLALRGQSRSWLLDAGFFVNLVGLTLVVGVDFTRNYVLAELADADRDALLEQGPTLPALLVASLVFVVGAVLFGVAMARSGFVPVAAWFYVVSSVPAAFVPVLPNWVSAGAQIVTGVAVLWMGRELVVRSRTADERLRADRAPAGSGVPAGAIAGS